MELGVVFYRRCKVRIETFLDKLSDVPMLPITLTENSERKSVRVAGCLLYILWFLPAAAMFSIVLGVLAIPAMIQDAQRLR